MRLTEFSVTLVLRSCVTLGFFNSEKQRLKIEIIMSITEFQNIMDVKNAKIDLVLHNLKTGVGRLQTT
jgi:hypothetical protein